MRVASDQRFRSFSLGLGRACVIAESGALYCWGSTARGLLGVEKDSVCARSDHRGECATRPKPVGGHLRSPGDTRTPTEIVLR